jgi:hypothetical protein
MPAHAATVFVDNFSEDTPGTAKTDLTNFYVGGTVDVVGAVNGYGISVTSNVVDLDGTPGPGVLLSKGVFYYNAGDKITLFFDLGGAQRGSLSDEFKAAFYLNGGQDIVDFGYNFYGTDVIAGSGFANFLSDEELIAGDEPLATRSIFFTAKDSGALQFAFSTTSADNIGPLLDNVRLDISPAAVPEPASWAMMIAGFGVVGLGMRRRRTSAKVSFA